MIKCNHPQFGKNNKEQLENLFTFILQHIYDCASIGKFFMHLLRGRSQFIFTNFYTFLTTHLPSFVLKVYKFSKFLTTHQPSILEVNCERPPKCTPSFTFFMIFFTFPGLTSWQGALYLTDWLIAGNLDLCNSRIFELGAGVGFLGLHLLKSIPSISSYYFTDGHRK